MARRRTRFAECRIATITVVAIVFVYARAAIAQYAVPRLSISASTIYLDLLAVPRGAIDDIELDINDDHLGQREGLLASGRAEVACFLDAIPHQPVEFRIG